MAFINPDETFGAQAERVFALYQHVCDVRDRHASADGDSRQVSFNNIAMAANGAVATLRLLEWARQGGDAMLIAALGLARPEFINLVAEDLLRASRSHLLVESQFQVETLFRNILIARGKSGLKQGFYNVAQDVLADAMIADAGAKLRLVNVPALMRNSMHANGIHRGYKGSSTTEVIDGIEFRFDDGRRVQCGSWLHITTALGAVISVVDQILSASSVSTIPVILDEYAAQKAAAGD